MPRYEDSVITISDDSLTIRHYGRPGSPHTIALGDILSVEPIRLGFWTGRARLVGFGPGRPLHFFHWDRQRASKRAGLSLDLGRRVKIAITPDDPQRVLDLLAG